MSNAHAWATRIDHEVLFEALDLVEVLHHMVLRPHQVLPLDLEAVLFRRRLVALAYCEHRPTFQNRDDDVAAALSISSSSRNDGGGPEPR
jgi:hypothetical protein